MLGSCFTEHIGQRLIQNKFQAVVNPFGVVYNPASIFEQLRCAMSELESPCSVQDGSRLFRNDGILNSWLHDSSFSNFDEAEFMSRIRKSYADCADAIRSVDVLFITMGTARAYILKETGQLVSNCHKQPASMFDEVQLSVEDIVNTGADVIQHILQFRPQAKIVFTVSPYRYAKYGFHGNQISKAILLLAVDGLINCFPNNAVYFPAYEIVNDELRDYRYYSDDLLHPSNMAVEYIWERFAEDWVAPESKQFMLEWGKILSDLNHRPFSPNSSQYKAFLSRTYEKINRIQSKLSPISFASELDEISQRLNNIQTS